MGHGNSDFRRHSRDVKNQRALLVCTEAVNSRVIEAATSGWMLETIVCSSLEEAQNLEI